jgi:hypothetical protein
LVIYRAIGSCLNSNTCMNFKDPHASDPALDSSCLHCDGRGTADVYTASASYDHDVDKIPTMHNASKSLVLTSQHFCVLVVVYYQLYILPLRIIHSVSRKPLLFIDLPQHNLHFRARDIDIASNR